MSNRRTFLKQSGLATAALSLQPLSAWAGNKKQKPNILWLSCEDISAQLGCYGDPHAITPTLDKFAKQGIIYKNAFTVAPVCGPNRSCIISGVYQNSLGTMHMRSGGEGPERSIKPSVPAQIKCFSEYLQQEGYYCTNNYKEDYQFDPPATAWNDSSHDAHWRNRPDPNTPFFSVFNYTHTHEGTVNLTDAEHKELTKSLTSAERQNPNKMSTLPPYYPDTPIMRKHWAHYYELITLLDHWVKDILEQLKADNLENDTIVFFWSDHGAGMPRAKRWLYDSGIKVPVIIRIPEKYQTNKDEKAGTVCTDLVSTIDFAPTVLNLAGADIPQHMQGQVFLGENKPAPREYIYAARDRMDERYDRIRAVRDKRFKYLRNYQPYYPYAQYMEYAENGPMMKEWRRVQAEGKLLPDSKKFMAKNKPVEELYDIVNDPHELNNLAGNPEYAKILDKMWDAHQKWVLDIKDLGLLPEPELAELDKKYPNRYSIFRQAHPEIDIAKIQAVAAMAGRPDRTDRPTLLQAMEDKDVSVRYWGAIGLGNLGLKTVQAKKQLTSALNDSSDSVRIAAARALCKMDLDEMGLPIVISGLQSEKEWVRLQAALVCDEIEEKAKPVLPFLEKVLNDPDNKYVSRVAKHTIGKFTK